MDKVYKLYFDYNSIRLSLEGEVTNENNCVYMAEYEWNEETETVGKFIRRVNGMYGRYDKDFPMDISVEEMEEMESLEDCFDCVQDAWDALYNYLEQYMVWDTIHGGWYEPDYYECVGLEDRDEIYYRTRAWKSYQEKQGA